LTVWQPGLRSADDIRGGGDPYEYMALVPRSRMDPSPRSFALDAHACIMVLVRMDQPNTSLRRGIASKASSPRKSSQCRPTPKSSPDPQACRGARDRQGLRRFAMACGHPWPSLRPRGQPSPGRDEEMSFAVEQGDDHGL